MNFFFCVPGHARVSIRWVKQSPLQTLHKSLELPVGIHRTGPCLASQNIEGGAELSAVVGGGGEGGRGAGVEDLCHTDILGGRFSTCGGHGPVLSLYIVSQSTTEGRGEEGGRGGRWSVSNLHYDLLKNEAGRRQGWLATYTCVPDRDRQTDSQSHRQTDRQRQTDRDRQTETEADRQTEKQREGQGERSRQTKRQVGRQTQRRQTDRLIDTKAKRRYSQIDRQRETKRQGETERQRERQTDRDRQTERERDRQTDTDRQTDRETNREGESICLHACMCVSFCFCAFVCIREPVYLKDLTLLNHIAPVCLSMCKWTLQRVSDRQLGRQRSNCCGWSLRRALATHK